MPRPHHREQPLPASDRVRIVEQRTLAEDWFVLKKTSLEYRRSDGRWQLLHRETYDRGNGAALLLFNRSRGTVVLVRQFRLPAFANGCADGMLVEACAGLLDDDDPHAAIRREAQEETGFAVRAPRKVFQAYMSPGSVTEKLHFFIAPYEASMRVGEGGGLAEEGEDIEVLETGIDEALAMVADGRIADAKTVMLLYHAKLHVFPPG